MSKQIRAQEAFLCLQLFAKLTLAILGWLSFARLLFFFTFIKSDGNLEAFSTLQVLEGFFLGFRFDLLVLGFLWIPFIFLVWGSSLWISPRKSLRIFKVYWFLCLMLIFNLTWMDFFWMAVQSSRLNADFHFFGSLSILETGWNQLGDLYSWILTLALAVSLLAVILFLQNLALPKTFSTPSRFKTGMRFFMTVLWVAFAARGTLTAHHLELAHTHISDDPVLNQLPLNAMWNMDKPAPQ